MAYNYYEHTIIWVIQEGKFEDTKGVIRSRKSEAQWPKEKGQIMIYKTCT
jgi:hypothetical protein